MQLTGPHIPQTWIKQRTCGTLCIVHPIAPSSTTDYLRAHGCLDPGLEGDPYPNLIGSVYRHMKAIHTTELHYELPRWKSCNMLCHFVLKMWNFKRFVYWDIMFDLSVSSVNLSSVYKTKLKKSQTFHSINDCVISSYMSLNLLCVSHPFCCPVCLNTVYYWK